MTTAYLRVSSSKQHLDNQKKEIQKFAESKGLIVQQWMEETASGTRSSYTRRLGEVIERLQKDDVLIVSEISRLSRTMLEVMSIFHICMKKEVRFYSIKEGYNLDDSINSKIIGFAFGLAAEIERNLISARTKEALACRKAAGIKLGRPTGYCPKQRKLEANAEEIQERIRKGEPLSRIAKHFDVSRNTLYTFCRKTAYIPFLDDR